MAVGLGAQPLLCPLQLQTSPGHPKALFIPKKLLAEPCRGICGASVLRGRYPTTCRGKETGPGQNQLVIFRQIIFA